MKYAFISPVGHMDVSLKGTFLFALSHIKDSMYWEWFHKQRSRRHWDFLLDNGVFETGNPDDTDRLKELCRLYKPTYVYAPDWIGDTAKTLDSIEKFALECRRSATHPHDTQVIGVVQGKSVTDRVRMAKELIDMPSWMCSMIAVPAEVATEFENSKWSLGNKISNSRVEFFRRVEDRGWGNHKPFSLTGLGNMAEVTQYKFRPWVWGVDSTGVVQHAVEGTKFDPISGTDKYKDKMDFHGSLSEEVLQRVDYNITIFKAWVDGSSAT